MIVRRVSCAKDKSKLPTIGHPNWVPAENVHVSFDIQHRGSSILLKYKVEEPQVRAVNTDYSSPVWEDSCVEFFIALEGDSSYYNFEFNAIGALLGAYGPDRNQRKQLPLETLKLIDTGPSLGRQIIKNLEGNIKWEMDIVIPVTVFCHHDLKDLAGKNAKANFYKCGDKLDSPHFLSWQAVQTDKPDFHLPAWFGDLEFA